MLDIAFKAFKAKKSRAAMCIVGVMICVLLIGSVNSMLYSMENNIKGEVANIGENVYFEQNNTGYPPIASNFDSNLVNSIFTLDEVDIDKSTNILFVNIERGDTPRDPAKVIGVGLTTGKERTFIGNYSIQGKDTLGSEDENAVILGTGAAEFYNVKLGDIFLVKNQNLKVVGIIENTDSSTIDNSVIMSLPYAQKIFNRNGAISAVLIDPNDGFSPQDVKSSIEGSGSYSDFGVYGQQDIEDDLNERLKEPRMFMGMISAMVLIVSIVLVMNVMIMAVKEKTKEIGTMRAIGTSRKSIILLVLYEALILSTIGGILGILLTTPVTMILGSVLGSSVATQMVLTPTVVLQVLAVVLLIGTLSGLVPVYLATRVSPVEALRYE